MGEDGGTRIGISENGGKRAGIIVPWAALAVAASGLIAWGANQARLANAEETAKQVAQDQRELARQVNTQDRQIAVIQSRLDTIIVQLGEINEKLERMERLERHR